MSAGTLQAAVERGATRFRVGSAAFFERFRANFEPRIAPAFMIDRHGRRRKRWVRKPADPDRDYARQAAIAIKHGHSADRAEKMRQAAAIVADADEFGRAAVEDDLVIPKMGVVAEGAASAAFAGQAMADRDADRFARAHR